MNNKKLKEIVKDRKQFGSIDPIEAVLFLTSRYTLLPDVFDIFGRDTALEFLERFGGKTIKIPSIKNVEEAVQQLLIWKALSTDETQDNYKRLGVKFGMKESEIRAARQRVQDMFNEQRKRFGRQEQEAEQRSKVGTEGTAEDGTEATSAYVNQDPDSLFGTDYKLVYTAYAAGDPRLGEAEGARSSVTQGDSELDR